MTTTGTQCDAAMDDVVHMLMLPFEEGGPSSHVDSSTSVTDSRDANPSSSLFTSVAAPILSHKDVIGPTRARAQPIQTSCSPTSNTRGRNHWYSARDPRTGKKYYFNKFTGRSQWEKPKPKHFKNQPRTIGSTSPKTKTTLVPLNDVTKSPDSSLKEPPTRNTQQNTATSSLPEWSLDVISLDDISENEPLAQDSISNRTQRASTDPPSTVQRAFSCGVSNEDRSGGVRKPNLRRVQSDCHVRPKSHVRRFTGGCEIEEERYQDDRIETTFQCTSMCILDLITTEEKRIHPVLSPVSVQDFNSSSTSLSIFDDDFENEIHKDTSEAPVEHETATIVNRRMGEEEEHFTISFDFSTQTTPKKGSVTKQDPQLPSVADILSFFYEIHAESNLEREVVIISLLYMERLSNTSHNRVIITRRNWRSLLYSSVHLANKVWGENQANRYCHYSATETDGLLDKIFSEQRIDKLEWALLKGLNYNVKVTAKDYAKIYFLARSKVTMSGLSDCSLNFKPFDFNGMKSLEDVSSRYEHHKKRTAETRRVKSMDNLSFLLETAAFS